MGFFGKYYTLYGTDCSDNITNPITVFDSGAWNQFQIISNISHKIENMKQFRYIVIILMVATSKQKGAVGIC